MRILDIGVATGYALLCLSLISVMNPYVAALQSDASVSDTHASEAVFAYIQAVGVVFLGDAPAAQVCASLQLHSNSTVLLGGTVGGVPCSQAPPRYEGESSVAISLSGRQVVIWAWVEAE